MTKMLLEFRMTRALFLLAVILHFIALLSFAQDGPCTCDLTQSACDPKCCCDSDCNTTDTAVFGCSNDYKFVQSCFPSSIMFRNYTPYTVNTSSGDGLACIYYDRFTARNYYTNPQVNANLSIIVVKAQSFAGFNFSGTTPSTDYSVYGSTYKAGNPVHIMYESGTQPPDFLRQPANCSNVLTSLTYNIKYLASSGGIYEASYDAELGTYDVSSGSYVLKQTFATVYTLSASGAAAAYPSSGNPGYLVGRPVLAGTRNLTSSSVQVNANPALWLTVPGANSADGACNFAADAGRRSVAFGEALQSSCWLELNAGSVNACASLDASVFNSLAGLGGVASGAAAVMVGSFGNTVATSLAGWVPIHVDNATCRGVSVQELATGCANLLLGGRLDLLTARTGSVANPQSSVVGARLQCVRGNVTFQCSTGACSSAATQRFLASYTVNFIDASATSTSGLTAPSSSFQQRLMRDFFYLLYVENGAGRPSGSAAIGCWLCPLLLLLGMVASHWLAA